jgi:hypothetical protein
MSLFRAEAGGAEGAGAEAAGAEAFTRVESTILLDFVKYKKFRVAWPFVDFGCGSR